MGLSSLDSYKHKCNRPCSKRAASGKVELEGRELHGYARLYCKGWRCRYCGPKKAAELREQITKKAKEHDLSRFLTLTLDPNMEAKIKDIKYIRSVWRKFRVYLKREFGDTVSFISVLELHKSGVPHLHVLVDRYIHQEWISEKWARLGGGRIVFIEKVKDLSAIGWYLAKYLTKEMILSAPNGVRRYSSSRNIKLREPREASGWILAKHSMETLYRAAGESIIREEKDANEHVKMFLVEREIEDVSGTGYEETVSVETEKGREWNGLLSTSGCLAKNKGMRDIRSLLSISYCGNTLGAKGLTLCGYSRKRRPLSGRVVQNSGGWWRTFERIAA